MKADRRTGRGIAPAGRVGTGTDRVALCVLTAKGVLCCDEAFCRVTGLAGPGAGLADLLAWIVAEDRERFSGSLAARLQGKGSDTPFELRGQKGNGPPLPCLVRMQPLRRRAGIVVHVRLVMAGGPMPRDRQSLEEEAKLHHEGRLAALGTMAAGIAHELNQPLNTIRVVTEGLLFGREQGWPLDTEEFFENIEMITRQVVRMDKVIQNIRNFGRENLDSETTHVNVNEAIENVFSMIGRQIEDHGIRVEKDLDPELPLLRTTPNAVEQVVMNLLINARQALDECDESLKAISIRTGRQNGKMVLEVSDNGPGIPPPLLDRIFDPFFTTKDPGKGTGLGLSICQSIVSRFGGHIEASNNRQGGATLRVTAPLQGGVP